MPADQMEAAARPAHGGASRPRVVIAHDFAETYGGAERIVAEIADVFPDAPVWVIAGRRAVARRMGVADRFHALLPERERLLRHYRWAAPLFPWLVRARPLPEADVLVTSSYAFGHAFATRNRAPQICFCYGPLRFAWSQTDAYADALPGGSMARPVLRAMSAYMRTLDRRSADRVTTFLCQGEFAAGLISDSYGREARIAPGPVDCDHFTPWEGPPDDFYLFCGRLVEAYKRPSLVVEAFRHLPGERLVIAGDGPARPELEARAPGNVEFLGHLDDARLIPLMQRCRAAIFPSRDDFGLIPLEVMACGRPVIAYADGGALETVAPGLTGEFIHVQTADAVERAVRAFDPAAYDPAAIRRHAERWDRRRFRAVVESAVREAAASRT